MRTFSRWRVLASVLAFWLGVVATSFAAENPVLVATNATWSYFKGTREPSPVDLATWRRVDFPDVAWSRGPAPFWYGEAGRFGGTGTEVADMQNAYSTLYLRHRWNVARPSAYQSLELAVMCDDGYLAWINGRLVASQLAPAGDPLYNALAGGNADEPVDYVRQTIPNADQVLQPGDNVLAIQVFNTSLGSSDIVAAAELTASPAPSAAPVITRVSPAPGPVNALTEITVTFSEPVRGVRAEDFLVDGNSATAVTGSGTTYTFTFPPLPFGAVGVAWTTSNTIEDFETPPRHFELADPSSTWGYELIDPLGPSVAGILPSPGSVVRALSQVEITFDKAVTGVDAADLRIGGVPATDVRGVGTGPYVFAFAAAPPGPATLTWAADHGIVSDSLEPHPLRPAPFTYTVDPQVTTPALVLTEFMAENLVSFRDEDRDPEDWIEIWNPTANAVNLAGWSLSNEADDPGAWVFPNQILPAGGYLVVFASGKDRRIVGTANRLHTSFKLNPTGGYVGLFGPELPRVAVSEVRYPEQGADFAYGRERNTGAWRFFAGGSPGTANGTSTIRTAVESVHFSATRGYYNAPFTLFLACPTPGATIRYTTNGSPPTPTTGFLYTNGLTISAHAMIRAAAFKPGALPSAVATHTYLLGLAGTRLRLPALSLVTATNNLFGRTGIMEVNPRNTSKRGAAWERPVSVEYLRPEDHEGFQVDCGLRLQGGDYVRSQYNYRSTQLPFSKYSFRLYFRGEYGRGRLEYPLFPETTQRSFDTIVLRAGMNDPSNPFIVDEFVRTLERDCGQPASVGTFVHLFLNGVYKGYYNPCERIDVDFLRAYHGGGEKWDQMAQFGEVREGDATAYNTLRNSLVNLDMSVPANYRTLLTRLDVTNFVDYLCPLIYADNDDWPHNNWRAARERAPGGLYRFYAWDAEWAFGAQGHGVSWDTIRNQLSSSSSPWGGADIQRIFLGLKKSPEFRLFFADRVQRHFFNGGALTDERLRQRWTSVTNRLRGVIAGFNNNVGTTWIPQRRKYVLQHLQNAGLLASSNAPAILPFGGNVASGTRITLTNLQGPLYFTTDGTDPRVSFTGDVAPAAQAYTTPLTLTNAVTLRARSLVGTNWSALTEATFQVRQPTLPLRFTEIMYHPLGDEAWEYLELANLGPLPINVSGFSLRGVDFRFPEPGSIIPPGAHWVLANGQRPAEFATRYPGVPVAGWFGGSLANGGETIELLDAEGQRVTAVTYEDHAPWPVAADGSGASLEFPDTTVADPSDPAAWNARVGHSGSPGTPSPTSPMPLLRWSEIAPAEGPNADWIELFNAGASAAALDGWSVSDSAEARRFVFAPGTTLAAGARLRLACTTNAVSSGATTATPAAFPLLTTGFALARDGGTLALYAPDGTRADAVTYGPIPTGFTLSRLGDSPAWSLSEPTPGAPNEPATLASPTRASLNEWLANAPAGEDDWVEIHNRDATAPLDLRGLHLATSNEVFQLALPTFIAPSGFVVLRADGRSAPGHLGLRLPASGGSLALLDAGGAELERVSYPSVGEGLTFGRVPDGTGLPILFAGTASPGASNYVGTVNAVRFNEFMARNVGAVAHPLGGFADWLELFNPRDTVWSLTGHTLEVEGSSADAWAFPAGVTIPARGFLVVWADPTRLPSGNANAPLNLGRGLPAEGGELRLRSPAGQVLDAVRYGPQLVDRAAGRVGDVWTLLESPTPGSANRPGATLGATTQVRINEWRAGDPDGDDWIELYNRDPLPVDLGGALLTDDASLAGVAKFTLPPLSFLAGHGFQRWKAEGSGPDGADQTGFRLDAAGESLRLYDGTRTQLDAVDFGPQAPRGSTGRFPDGAEELVEFSDSASPGAENWLPHPDLVINEVLAHTDPPLEDAVEFFNAGPDPVDVSGWYLSNDAENPQKFRLPQTSPLAPGDFHVLYEGAFNVAGSPGAFTFNSAHGDDVWLSEADPAGNRTGYRVHATLPATANGVSVGRVRTSTAWDFTALSRRTFGKDLPGSIAEFRTGRGLANAAPLVGPLVLTEVHYHPITGAGTTNVSEPADEEFVEVFNPLNQPVPLYDPAASTNTWRVRGGIDFEFPSNTTLAAGAYALITAIAPTNTPRLAAFRQRYAVPAGTLVVGPFRGRLANDRESLRLERPDTPQAPPHPDAGFVPYLIVDAFQYQTDLYWPIVDDDSGRSLQRRRATDYANDPTHWIAAAPTAGATTAAPDVDRDLDGLPNDWELQHGLNPDDPADATADPDGDGLANTAEFLAGTDPHDAASRLTLAVGISAGGERSLRFRAAAQRTYAVESSEALPTRRWERLTWIEAQDADHDVEVPLSADAADGSTRFYRIVTPATP